MNSLYTFLKMHYLLVITHVLAYLSFFNVDTEKQTSLNVATLCERPGSKNPSVTCDIVRGWSVRKRTRQWDPAEWLDAEHLPETVYRGTTAGPSGLLRRTETMQCKFCFSCVSIATSQRKTWQTYVWRRALSTGGAPMTTQTVAAFPLREIGVIATI